MITQEHIEQSIQKALNGTSGIDADMLKVRGFSTYTIRNLFHALCNTDVSLTYLEIGLFCGATFCSSFNKKVTAIGVENHSQDFSEGFELVAKELKENVEKFKDKAADVKVVYDDCYTMDKSLLPDNIDIYFYDGFHSEETQAKALPHFFDKLADRFIWIVDDANWDYVASGTAKGIDELKDKIEVERKWELKGAFENNDPIWHNGVVIFLINKK